MFVTFDIFKNPKRTNKSDFYTSPSKSFSSTFKIHPNIFDEADG